MTRRKPTRRPTAPQATSPPTDRNGKTDFTFDFDFKAPGAANYQPSGSTRKSEPIVIDDSSSSSSSSSSDDGDAGDDIEVQWPPRVQSPSPQERAEQAKERGNSLFRAKAYDAAVKSYSEAIELNPTDASYRGNRAAAYMALRTPSSWTKALDDCLAAQALYKDATPPKVRLRTVKVQLALGLVREAERSLESIREERATLDPLALQSLSAEDSRVAAVKRHLANIQRERSGKNWPMVQLGLDQLAKTVEVMPREWRTWELESLVGRKKFEVAASKAADMLRGDQKQPEALYFRGLCLYLQGNTAQAIAHATEALRNDPDFAPARTLVRRIRHLDALKDAGNDAFKKSDWDTAIAKYTEALEAVDVENDQLRATLLSNRATAHLKKGEHEEALQDCSACIEAVPTYFKAFRTRARVKLAQSEFEDAVRDFDAAKEHAPATGPDVAALKREIQDAQVALKKSKMKDHYKVLGIESTATEYEIKKAYKVASLKTHPDKAGGSDAAFKEVGEAYAVLMDPQRRRKFDAGIDENDPVDQFGGGGGFPGGHAHPFASSFGGGPFASSFGGGPFASSFGGGGGGGGYSFYDDDDDDLPGFGGFRSRAY